MGPPQLQSSGFQTAYYRTPLKKGSPSLANMGRTPEQAIDLTDDSPPSSSRKRKAEGVLYQTPSKWPRASAASHNTWPQRSKASAASSSSSRKSNAGGASSYHTPSKQSKAKKSQGDGDDAPKEKRLRRFRPKAPQSFHDIYARALPQRFFVLKRSRGGTGECPEERIEMTGSTGNIYTVSIGEIPRCNCPHAEAGNQCKHILYIIKRVLNAPDNLVYQLALVPSELRLIFSNAPPIHAPDSAKAESNNRKPVEGDCPICFCEFEAKEDIVWCRAACGQNIHKQCFQMWAKTKGAGKVTCPFCRSGWQDVESVSEVRREDGVMDEGYVNVADQLGISRERDESTYSSWYGMPTYAYNQRRGGGFLSRRDRVY